MEQEIKPLSIAKIQSRPRPVLMTPLRRCGSHALRLRLNNSPEFYSPYPLHIIDFMPLLPRYGDLRIDQNYFRLIVDVIGLQTSSMVKWNDIVFDPVDIFEAIKQEKRSIHRVLWELLLRAGELHHASIVMDKSLDSVRYADELLELFPDMLFLNVVRDPRAQVASMNRAIIHEYDATLNALAWVDAHKMASALIEKYPDSVLTIRYEDFLSNQELVLRRICEFLGISFLPAMLDVSHSQEALQISQLSALWESNRFPPLMANKDKFRQQLSLDEIEVIETLCKSFMQKYGYEAMTPANADITQSMLAVAGEKSLSGRLQAWADLKENNFKDYILRRYRADYLGRLMAMLPPPA
ncbi:sulfotransferase family protein [Undibacterium griseum]|uniref:Sulfotransferase n=1 Tax=Undibacterium griseum TaxID=2762295 RepID=A0ABR6YM46_9BURK|nr:sulfotransferase [Undibacterium griseum]MBC3884973.1 sulfotransferase [Undibacterium griseum]